MNTIINKPPVTKALLAGALGTLTRHVNFTTAHVIRAIAGKFVSDHDTPVKDSWNASVGRGLSTWAHELGIKREHSEDNASDDIGTKTTVQHWSWLPRP